MQFKHVAALLLPLSSVVTARPIEQRSDNGLLNILSTIGGAGNPNDQSSHGSFLPGIFKRQILGWSFEPISMINKVVPLGSIPFISGLGKRDAEVDQQQEKRALDGTLNLLSDIGGTGVSNHPNGGGFLGIFKREAGEVEKRGGFLGLGCLLNIGSDTACSDQGTSKGIGGIFRRQLGGANPLSLLTSLLGGFGGLGGSKSTTSTTPTLPNGQTLPNPQQF